MLCLALLGPWNLHAQSRLLIAAPEPMAGSAAVVAVSPSGNRAPLPGMTVSDWTLLGAAAGLRYLDYQTTVKALSDPADLREAELPQALVDNHAAFAAFEASTVVANYWIYRLMVRHGHRRLARAGQVINLSLLGGTIASNEYNLARYYRPPPH